MMMYSVTDMQGLNSISRQVLANGAHAMAGMVKARLAGDARGARVARAQPICPPIGLTMFGVTTPCVQQITARCSKDEYECLVFHATGVGGQSMEKLVDAGMLAGVIDITTTEICDLLMGGVLPATEDRFGAMIRARMPYVGSCRRARHGQFRPAATPCRRITRAGCFYQHNPQVTLMRTTAEENERMGRWIGERLNQMEAPVRFFLPEGGVSALDTPGGAFHDQAADAALFRALEQTVRQTSTRQLIRVPRNINDPAFVGRGARGLPRRARRAHAAPPGGEVTMPLRTLRPDGEIPRHGRRAASRSSAAAPAPAFPRNARRPAASTSSSSTIPAATAWPGAARSPACMPYGDANAIVDGDGRRGAAGREADAGAGRRQRHRSVPADGCVPRSGEGDRLRRRAEFSDRRHHRRHLPRQSRRDRHVLRARGRHDRARRARRTC